MKKILVLMLVLGIASMASAGLTWSQSTITVTPGTPFTVSLITSDTTQGFAFLEPGDDVAVTAISEYPAAGDDASSLVYTTGAWAGWGKVTIYDSGAPFNVAPGVVFDVTMVATTGGSMGSDYYTYFGANDVLTVIPEPMTLALLGLGGLFLRRRK